MTRSVRSSARIPALCSLLLAAATFAFGCSKETKSDGDAAADATVEAAVADAAVADAEVDAADASDAATAPLATTAAVKPKPPAADPPICAAARAAKKRGSPAAPGLETQCRAAGGTL